MNLHRFISVHALCMSSGNAMVQYADMEWEVCYAANFWRKVLACIVNVPLTLASCNMAFRGHRETIGQGKSGNFLFIIELLAHYDHVLK